LHCVGVEVEKWCLDVEEEVMPTDIQTDGIERGLVAIGEVDLQNRIRYSSQDIRINCRHATSVEEGGNCANRNGYSSCVIRTASIVLYPSAYSNMF